MRFVDLRARIRSMPDGAVLAAEAWSARGSTGIAQLDTAVAALDRSTPQAAERIEQGAGVADNPGKQAAGLLDSVAASRTTAAAHRPVPA